MRYRLYPPSIEARNAGRLASTFALTRAFPRTHDCSKSEGEAARPTPQKGKPYANHQTRAACRRRSNYHGDGHRHSLRRLGAERALSGSGDPDPRPELCALSLGPRRRRAHRDQHALVRGPGLFRRRQHFDVRFVINHKYKQIHDYAPNWPRVEPLARRDDAKQKTSTYTISVALICVCLVICCHGVVIFCQIDPAAIVGSNFPFWGHKRT